ncbi:MAG: outer membrane protein transport protein [Bdellovibrionota bacterium]|nr:MAG: hypothetical protein EOP10_13370 [Pseudomonadota bacterium]
MQVRNARSQSQTKRFLSFTALGLSGMAVSSSLFAAGFALRNHSASGVGTSLASDTVNTFDASGILSNPAVMSAFKGNSISLNINYTDANIKAKDGTLTPGPQLRAGRIASYPVAGPGSESEVSEPVVIPSIYNIYQVSEQVHVGWSFNVPYGTNTEYDNNWAGRYHGLKTELQAYDVGIHGSYKITDMIAAGISLSWQQAKGELSSAADLGAVNYAVVGNEYQNGRATLADLQTAGAGIGRNDAIGTYKGDSTAFAYGVGFLIKPWEGSRLGLSYKGQVNHEAKGDFKWGPTTAQAGSTLSLLASGRVTGQNAGRFQNSSDAKLDLTLPPVASIGYAHDISDFTVYGNVTHTGWSTLKELNPEYNGQEVVTQLRWNDSVYYAIGADYRFSPEWTIRYGVGRDQSVTDTDHRTPRTPDGDRTALSIGGSYKMGAFDFSAAFQQLFLEDTESQLNASAYTDNNGRGTFKAKYEISPSIAVVSAGYSF